ncbi:hypothetical protein GCM10010245_91720 [Streptomyces spectabilis]|nr:hypothetical protein GCM10010245_91720 [Streptomyces spectabilis]
MNSAHTLHELAEAIDDAFARWDRSQRHEFEFPATGMWAIERRYRDSAEDPRAEFDADTTRVSDAVQPGQEFHYTYDLGNHWSHICQIEPRPIDVAAVLDCVPQRPLPYRGWGTIPDPNGRLWDGDNGRNPVPPPPHQPWPWSNAPAPTLTTLHSPGQYTLLQNLDTQHR